MDWDALFNYLGTGGGLIVLLNWLAGLPLLRRKQKLDRDDVSRQMAARDNETIIRLYDEVRTFRNGWRPSRVAWRRWWYVLFMAVALLATSCRSTSGSTTIQRGDSLRWQRKVSIALAAIPARTLAFQIPPDSLLEGRRLVKEADGLRLTAELDKGTLNLSAETDAIPGVTYTADETIDRVRESSAQLEEVKEPAAMGILEKLKPVLAWSAVIILLVFILIISIKLWQRKKEMW